MANAFHAAHAPRATAERPEAAGPTRWAVRALSVVSCWCRTFGVFGYEMGDGVYFLGREVDGTGTPAKA